MEVEYSPSSSPSLIGGRTTPRSSPRAVCPSPRMHYHQSTSLGCAEMNVASSWSGATTVESHYCFEAPSPSRRPNMMLKRRSGSCNVLPTITELKPVTVDEAAAAMEQLSLRRGLGLTRTQSLIPSKMEEVINAYWRQAGDSRPM